MLLITVLLLLFVLIVLGRRKFVAVVIGIDDGAVVIDAVEAPTGRIGAWNLGIF